MRSATREATRTLPQVAATALSGATAGFLVAGVPRLVILDPALLQAAIFVVLAGFTGVVAVAIEPWMESRVTTERAGASVAHWAIVAAGAVFAVPFSFLFFSEKSCGCLSPPWLVGGAIVALGLVWLARFVIGQRRNAEPRWLGVAGPALVVTATLAGLVHLAGEVTHFA